MDVVLLCAGGASWEPAALRALDRDPGTVVLRRCVDVDDLAAAATAGQAQVALVGTPLPGLDAGAVGLLRRHGLAVLAVAATEALDQERAKARSAGVTDVLDAADIDHVPEHVRRVVASAATRPAPSGSPAAPQSPDLSTSEPPARRAPVVAVWGPSGGPGASTVAAALAGAAAAAGWPTVLVDADPAGGSIAQQLGILDEVSGLLAAARLATTGHLEERFDSVPRRLDDRLAVVTGLPRADRWAEVRGEAVEELAERARCRALVVLDAGSCLEEDPGADFGARPGRHDLTLAALGCADAVVAVGTPDPVGLARLVRGLARVEEVAPGSPVHVVLNRMRATLGWSEAQVRSTLDRTGVRAESVHVVPDDAATVDRALVAGRIPVGGEFGRAVGQLLGAIAPGAVPEVRVKRGRIARRGVRLRERTAGTARPR